MKYKPVYFLILLVLSSYNVEASNVFNFLRFAGSARAAGLAGSFVTIENDISSIYYNPATLYSTTDNNFSITYFKHALDINSGNVVYKLPFEWEGGKIAVNAMYTNFGSFDYANSSGDISGTFSANDLTLGMHYANQIDSNINYGVGVKYIFANVEKYSSSAFACDFGLFYKLQDGRTNLGLSLLNVGSQVTTFNGDFEPLPIDLRIGFNHQLKGMPLLFNASFNHLADKTDTFFQKFKSFSVGGEFSIGNYVQLRLGFDNHIRTVITNELDKGFSGFSSGIGIRTEYVNFDYGLSMYNSSLNLHKFSFYLNL
ncbi:MAG: hypothetical protein A2X64_02690 [Ignavibacteria bacterium GWF2_33_9]|nr:MAG: hypothetical protein A2X64_02690 [Ignavibacteria bacterium GWF2_33_9]